MTGFQKILALDTAMNGCCAGFYDAGGGKTVSRAQAMASGQGERLIPLVQDVLREGGAEFADLDVILTTVGPGAFTGLRIGMAAAKSLGLALGIPVLGITNLQALALQYAAEKKPAGNIAVIIETKRQDFYFQTFTAGAKALSAPAALAAYDIMNTIAGGNFIALGDGLERFLGTPKVEAKSIKTDPGYNLTNTGFLARFLAENPQNSGVFTENPEPLYLRGADVTMSKSPQRTIRIS